MARLLPFLALGGIPTIGLSGNTLYDIIDSIGSNESVGDVLVHAMTANVTCGFLPNSADYTGPGALGACFGGHNLSYTIPGYLSGFHDGEGILLDFRLSSYTTWSQIVIQVPS